MFETTPYQRPGYERKLTLSEEHTFLPDNWSSIEANMVYLNLGGQKVSFGERQIVMGQRYDPQNKHLQAIQKGEVSPRGRIGLVPSEGEETQ